MKHVILFGLAGFYAVAIFTSPCHASNAKPTSEDLSALSAAAQKGDARAQYELGFDYHYGLGVKKDNDLALEWVRKSAALKYAPAEHWLAKIPDDGGWGTVQAQEGQNSLMQEASDKGYGAAKFDYGVMYEMGLDGVSPDHNRAEQLWKESLAPLRSAARQGDADADIGLSTAYDMGFGVEKDEKESFKWILKAAKDGSPMAEATVAYYYQKGKGVPKDDTKAMKWLQSAASHGEVLSQAELGKAYAKGEGVPKDITKAYMWLSIAIVQGDSRTLEPEVVAAVKAMTPEQNKEAVKEANEWQTQHLAHPQLINLVTP